VTFMINKRLSDYPVSWSFPFHLSINKVYRHFPAHRHDFLELSLVIEGNGYERINGKKHPMQPGTFTFLLPHQVHEIFVTSSQPLRLYNCMFDFHLLQSPLEGLDLRELLFTQDSLPSFVHLSGRDYEKMRGRLEEMLEEFSGTELWRNRLLQARLAEVLIHFDRERRRQVRAGREVRGMNTKSVWPIVQYIYFNYREPITLSGLADKYGMSSSYLSEEFKKHVGMNFVRFLHEVRVRHACGLLATTNMSGCDIAMESGFGSFKSFSRIFRELKGMAPGEFRKRCHGLKTEEREAFP